MTPVTKGLKLIGGSRQWDEVLAGTDDDGRRNNALHEAGLINLQLAYIYYASHTPLKVAYSAYRACS